MSLEMKKFNMRDISFKPNENKGPVVVLVGRRDTGKSFLVRDLLYYHQDIPIGTVISVLKLEMVFYSHVQPYHDEYNTAIIEYLKTTKGSSKTN